MFKGEQHLLFTTEAAAHAHWEGLSADGKNTGKQAMPHSLDPTTQVAQLAATPTRSDLEPTTQVFRVPKRR